VILLSNEFNNYIIKSWNYYVMNYLLIPDKLKSKTRRRRKRRKEK